MLLITTSVFLFKNIYSQNLIQNGSFENYTNIDCTYGGLDNGNPPYNHVLDNWYGYSSPDYFNTICSSAGWYNVPNNIFGTSYAKANNSYIGILTYTRGSDIKEYIYQHLTQPLQTGEIYCLSFFASKADRISYSIKNIGAFFSNSLPPVVNNYQINATPQVFHTGAFISDTTQWIQIQGCFTANGGEQYITIGNFSSNSITDTLNSGTLNPIPFEPDEAYYYIDDITLIEQTTVGLNELSVSNHFSVFPNPNNGAMQMDYDLGTDNNAVMNLFDVTGKLIRVYTLENSKGTMLMNEQSLHNGIYFYRILVGDKIIKNDKIVIIK